jgi:hypothetical protein
LAHKIRLATAGGGRLKQPSPGYLPLAAFEVAIDGRF